jgi:hypothetical protein
VFPAAVANATETLEHVLNVIFILEVSIKYYFSYNQHFQEFDPHCTFLSVRCDISQHFMRCDISQHSPQALLKTLSMGFILGEGSYLKDPWNVMDFIILLGRCVFQPCFPWLLHIRVCLSLISQMYVW